MFLWRKVTRYLKISSIMVAAIFFLLSFYFGSLNNNRKITEETVNINVSNIDLDNPAISFSRLGMNVRKIPPLPSEDQWQSVLDSSAVSRERLEVDVQMYGDFVKRFYASDEYKSLYIDVRNADLTSDGIPEKILSFDGGGTYGIIKYEIVSGDKIIATIEPESVGRGGSFQPGPLGNGFLVTWYKEYMFPIGYCCPVEQITTTFKYEDMKFVAREEKLESIVY